MMVIPFADFDLAIPRGIFTFICTTDKPAFGAREVPGAFYFVCMASLTAVRQSVI